MSTRTSDDRRWPQIRKLARRAARPVQRFLAIEAASSIVLIAAAVLAIAWANSPWAGAYHRALTVELGPLSVHGWINDGLMTVFFFVVGLELRGELQHGQLRTLRRAALPAFAALGGMLAPAAIYAAINAGGAGAAGWGIPMATDIAFAVGVLTLLGARVGPAPRVLLLALAVIDDLGAILVISAFYAAGAVHPTLAGVVLGLLLPPSPRLQRAIHPWVAFGVMPIFALANAGVALGAASFTGDAGRAFFGIVAGLVAGKPLGVYLVSRAALRVGLADAPELGRRGLALVGLVAGIGFTMSLFIAQLAFPPGALRDTATLAILVSSALAAALGLAAGAALNPSRTPPA